MRVIYKKPYYQAQILELEDGEDLIDKFQELCHGYIQCVTHGDSAIICNEDGKLTGMTPNVRIGNNDYVGPIVICGLRGEFCDVPNADDWLELLDSREVLL